MIGAPSPGLSSKHHYKELPVPPQGIENDHDSLSSPDSSESSLNATESSESADGQVPSHLINRVTQIGRRSAGGEPPAPGRKLPDRPYGKSGSSRESSGSNHKAAPNSKSTSSLKGPEGSVPSPACVSKVQNRLVGESQTPGLKRDIGGSRNQGLISTSQQAKSEASQLSTDISKEIASEVGKGPPEEKPYKLRDITAEERGEIDKRLAMHPEFTQKYDITRIQKVIDPGLEKLFEAQKESLKRATSIKLNPAWEAQETSLREKIDASINSLATKDRNVYVLRAFHGAKRKFQDDILASGIHFIGIDPGYFGQGPYASTDPQYCAMYGGEKGDGVIFIVDLVFRRLYPVAPCEDFMAAPIKPGFDGHAMRVVPVSDRQGEKMYKSCQPWDEKNEERKIYHEVVVRDHSQMLIRYAMEYTLKEAFALQKTWTRDNLRESIFDYFDKYPTSDLFIVLNRLLDEINGTLEQKLNPKEQDLLHQLQRSLEEDDANSQINLGAIQKLLPKDDSSVNKLPSSYITEQERQEAKDENLQRGDDFYGKGQFEKAIKAYEKTLEHIRDSFRANLGCARAFNSLKNWDKAIFHFEEARKIKPDDPDARRDHVSALINNDNLVGAAKLLSAALYKDPLNIEIMGKLATIYLSKGCIKQAYCLAAKALAFDATYAAALRVRGIYYYYACFDPRLGDSSYEKARKDLSRQTHPQALIHLARLYIAMNRVQEAQETCDLLLTSDSKSMNGLMIRAKISLMQKQPKEAESYISKCEKAQIDEFVIPALRGELCLQQDKLKDALIHLNKSVEIYRAWEEKKKILKKKDYIDFYYVLLLRAEAYFKMKSLQPALEDYAEAIKLFSDRPEAYRQRGNLYRLWDKKDMANADDIKAKELESILDAK